MLGPVVTFASDGDARVALPPPALAFAGEPWRTTVQQANVALHGWMHHTVQTRVALIPEVLHDIEECIRRFEVGGLRSFASFQAQAAELCICDLFDTVHAGDRLPSRSETMGQYAELLFEAIVRRLADAELRGFHDQK